MSSILNNKLPKFSERILMDFCPDCSNRRKCQGEGLLFVPDDGICKAFTWVSEKRREEWEQQVRESTAVTTWLKRGKSLQEIYAMSASTRLSVLTGSAIKEKKSIKPVAKQQVKKHYFYCVKPNKEKVTYSRNPESKSYQAEIVSFRKFLAKNNIKIIKEEIK